jgi:hypothetical protein
MMTYDLTGDGTEIPDGKQEQMKWVR